MKACKPMLVLGALCLLTTAALSLTWQMAQPRIYENENAAAVAARRALLPQAAAFELLPLDSPGVVDAARADTGHYVISAQAQGYGGPVPVMVALDGEGSVLALAVLDNQETPGLGKRVEEEAFLHQLVGQGPEGVPPGAVDAVAGATISSQAVVEAVNAALTGWRQLTQGG